MKKLAIRQNIGNWIYYVTTLSFDEVNRFVKPVDNELHHVEKLQDMIQRSLTQNVDKIKTYILSQEERFFNSLVLAVYDGDPEWREIRIDYGNEETYDLGVLEFSGEEKIFPVDGQHRVEGIKMAILENSELLQENIPVIFIGHKNDNEGMQRTRRLFSTLNRYAKPVNLSDIIALDEDDSIAIATRNLIENNSLFQGKRFRNDKQKAIPKTDFDAFSNIITIYECNKELLAYFLLDKEVVDDSGKKLDKKAKLDYYCRFRPIEEEVASFISFVQNFWDAFCTKISIIREYLSTTAEPLAKVYRNEVIGGSLLFRPIGQVPFVQCAINLHKDMQDWQEVFTRLNQLNLTMNIEPWKNLVWNMSTNRVERATSQKTIKLLMQYLIDKTVLSDKDKNDLLKEIRAKKQLSDDITDEELIQGLDECTLNV